MSTRCHIIVVKELETHYVYHHCDGYLNGVGADLKDFIKNTYEPIKYTPVEFCEQLSTWDDSYEFEDVGIHGDEEFIYYILLNPESITVSAKQVEHKKAGNSWEDSWKNCANYTEEFILDSLNEDNIESWEDIYTIIGWPEIQAYMDEPGFRENSTLINPNPYMNIDNNTYLVDNGWLKSL